MSDTKVRYYDVFLWSCQVFQENLTIFNISAKNLRNLPCQRNELSDAYSAAAAALDFLTAFAAFIV